jgi:hypothetical protein
MIFASRTLLTTAKQYRRRLSGVLREIETELAHWVEREAGHGPYRLRATRKPAADGEDEDTDDGPPV